MRLGVSAVLDAISDDASLELFKLVAATNGTSEIIRSNMKITRKQYYTRLFRLVHRGLIARRDSKYFLTAVGKVTFDAQISIENALSNSKKPSDSFEVAQDFPSQEKNQLIDIPKSDAEIKDVLIE